ncbi:MAG TPA: ATP-dependent zinc metalloprotease FtsH [Acidimicrobiales bacterium]|nr:ATP-dependent zinc metalloprotease FtsH [Acidimicrobiales bacterium]
MTVAGADAGPAGSTPFSQLGERWTEFMRRRRRRAAARRRRGGKGVMLLVSCLAVLLLAVVWSFAYLEPSSPGKELSIDQLAGLTEQARVKAATFLDQDARIVGEFVGRPVLATPPPAPPTAAAPGAKVPVFGGKFWVSYPRNDATTSRLIERMSQSGAIVRVDPQTSKASVRIVLTVLLPLVILANLFALFFVAGRGTATGLGDVTDFSRIGGGRGRGGRVGHGAITFADVAGADEAVAELAEVVDYLANPDRYKLLNAAPPKGVLLFGPPGCGKTLLAKAVAGEAGVPFFSVAGAEFVESLVGVGAARVRDLFTRVRGVAPAIVFIDELDAAGRRRGGGSSGGGADERDQTLNQLLVEMDGFEASSGIVVIGATNRPDILDPALLRPGRFDRHITIERPDLERRQAILELHARRKPLEPGIDFHRLARQTPGFSGADLANVVNEGALLTIREGGHTVGARLLTEAVQRVLAGPQRRGHLMSAEERQRIAVQEAGRAILVALSGRGEDIHRVSIVARAHGYGTTLFEREDDAVLRTEGQLLHQLTTSMAGRAAELLVFGDASTGTENDIETATSQAREMVGRYGLSPALGPQRLLASEADIYLGASDGLLPLAEPTHDRFDAEVRRVLDAALARSVALLRRHRTSLDRLTEHLLAEETVEGDELQQLLPDAEPMATNGATPKKAAAARKSTARARR